MDFTKDFFNLLLDFGDEWVITKVETDHRKLHVYLYLEYVSDYYEDPDTKEIALGLANKHDRHTFHFEIRVIDLL